MFDIIALDADDTLWHNEPLFEATHDRFRDLLLPYHSAEWISERLHATELRNLQHFGYGIKGFTLSMVETAIELTEGRITGAEIATIIEWGRGMLQAPIELLEGVRDTVALLAASHRLMLLTKGDLLDQEAKLARSGLGQHFSAVEVVSEKNAATYAEILGRYGVAPERFLMVGNSLKSDVLPVLEAGAIAVHVPYTITWVHERVTDAMLEGREFARLASLHELPGWLAARR